jgi:hypothetical protein
MVTVILEGGMVRDVVGADAFDVIDLDILGGDFTTDEERAELLAAAEALPADYDGRPWAITTVQTAIAEAADRADRDAEPLPEIP